MTAPNHKPISEENLNRFKAYHSKWYGWGNMHLVLGNKNIKDTSVETCKSYALANLDSEGAALCDVLMGMSKSQRLKLPSQVV